MLTSVIAIISSESPRVIESLTMLSRFPVEFDFFCCLIFFSNTFLSLTNLSKYSGAFSMLQFS